MATQPKQLASDEVFTGYRYDLEDVEFLRAGSRPFLNQILTAEYSRPNEMDPRKWFRIRNQGNQGSCRGHSGAAGMEHCWHCATGEMDVDGDGEIYEQDDDRFSPQWFYITTQQFDRIHGDRGSTIAGGVKTSTEAGCCREALWLYEGRYDTEPDDWNAAKADAAKFKLSRHHFFEPSATVFDDCLDWLGSNQGYLDIGQVWPLPFSRDGVVDGLSAGARGGGHATACLGYVARSTWLGQSRPMSRKLRDEEEKLLVVANSHGTRAQRGGFYAFTKRGWLDLLRHRYTVVVGMSDMINARPRHVDWDQHSIFHPFSRESRSDRFAAWTRKRLGMA